MSRRGVAVLALCAVAGAGGQLARLAVEPIPPTRHPQTVAEYDGPHYAGLADVLPPHGVVGYVGDDPDDDESTLRYYASQYALAPLVLVPGDRPERVLVDDPSAPAPPGRRLRGTSGGARLYGPGGR